MPRIERSATATWAGSVARGSGQLSSPSLVLHDAPFSLAGRTAAVTSTVALDQVGGFNRIVAGELTVEVVTAPLADDELEAALGEADERCPFSAPLRDAGATVTVALTSHVTS